MGVLKRFEQRLEGLVNGTFAKVFKSEVQPVEIAGALQRECDNNATIWNRDRTVVPNDFIVELSAPDYERLSPYSGQLGDELAGLVRDYAKQQRYTFMGPIKVHLEKADDLDTGLYRVRSRTLASSSSPSAQPLDPGHAGPAAPPPGQGRPGGYGYPPAGAPPTAVVAITATAAATATGSLVLNRLHAIDPPLPVVRAGSVPGRCPGPDAATLGRGDEIAMTPAGRGVSAPGRCGGTPAARDGPSCGRRGARRPTARSRAGGGRGTSAWKSGPPRRRWAPRPGPDSRR